MIVQYTFCYLYVQYIRTYMYTPLLTQERLGFTTQRQLLRMGMEWKWDTKTPSGKVLVSVDTGGAKARGGAGKL